MTKRQHEALSLLDNGPVRRGRYPRLDRVIDHLVATDRAQTLLPGVYFRPGVVSLRDRARAVAAWDPDAVLIGRTAAQLTFWPDLPGTEIEIAVRRGRALHVAGYATITRSLPFGHSALHRGIRFTTPAVTALDLCLDEGAEPIYRVLRQRLATVTDLRRVLQDVPGRRGNQLRRRMVLDAAANPWSEAERELHGLLRRHRLTGWAGNVSIRVRGQRFFADVLFRRERVIVEIDGRHHDTDPDVFRTDRHRQNLLVLAGYLVLRFTWADLRERPDVVIAQIRQALHARDGGENADLDAAHPR